MRSIAIVAWREFTENAKTKGFWIGLFLLPAIFAASIFVQQLLDEATPTRHFVLIDPSGTLTSVIDEGLERADERARMRAFNEYIARHGGPEAAAQRVSTDDPRGVETWIASGGIDGALRRVEDLLLADAPPLETPRRPFTRIGPPPGVPASGEPQEVATALRPWLRGEQTLEIDGRDVELFAAVLVPRNVEQLLDDAGTPGRPGSSAGIEYWSANLADGELLERLQLILDDEARRRQYVARGMDADTVRAIQSTRVPLSSLNPKKEAGDEQVGMGDVIRQWAPVGFVYLLWIGIFSISQMLLNNMIEEKSNRIIEVLLSSVTARQLMLGKLLGIAAVGITMLSAWIGSLVVGLAIYTRGEAAGPAAEALEVLRTSGLLPAFAIYFVLGYLMYATIFLTIGSVCNTLKEAQNLMGPVMLIMIVPLFTMMFIPKDPNGTLATILSWIPLYTPFVMMNRAAADPPLFDLVGTLVLLLATTAGLMWLSGRIFRIGILRTGQPPRLIELLRWIRG